MEDEIDHISIAKREKNKAEHALNVSVKYIKTVDVLRNGLERMISTMYHLREHLLQIAYNEDLIDNIPKIEKFKNDLLIKLINMEEFNELISFQKYLRDLMKLEFTKHCEFRKHMHMLVQDPKTNEKIEINLAKSLEFFDKLNSYMKLTKKIIDENFFVNEKANN